MYSKLFLFISIAILSFINLCAQDRIVIEGLPEDSCNVTYSLFNYVGKTPMWESAIHYKDNYGKKAVILTSQPVTIYPLFILQGNYPYVAESGDSIRLQYFNRKAIFTGKGAEKFNLVNSISAVRDSFNNLYKDTYYDTRSMDEYWTFSCHLDEQLREIGKIIDLYRDNISESCLERLKANVVSDIEFERVSKFYALAAKSRELNINNNQLLKVMDSTLSNDMALWLRSVSNNIDNVNYYYIYSCAEVFIRKYKFDFSNTNINTTSKRRLACYNYLKDNLKGNIRNKLLTYIVYNKAVADVGFTIETEYMLNDYYGTNVDSISKEWMRIHEDNARKLSEGDIAPDFCLSDKLGREIKKEDFLGKVVLLCFLGNDSTKHLGVISMLRSISNNFKNEDGWVSLIINKDHSKLDKEIPADRNIVQLHDENKGIVPIKKAYRIKKDDPGRIFLIDVNGSIVSDSLCYMEGCIGESLSLINDQLVFTNDGPYIIEDNKNKIAYSIQSSNVVSERVDSFGGENYISVHADQPKKLFNVILKSQVNEEPSEFKSAEKLYVLSDIEGNFKAFRELLIAGGIIDQDYNWTFGDGHLVLLGDFFDRGKQVTECLWLIYMLEQKSMEKGGYVHFILGNHEVMNLSGDDRYVQTKYKTNAKKLYKRYQDLFGNNSELGKWLRTKNVVEKIGDMLFVHAGLSEKIVESTLSLSVINSITRKYIDSSDIVKRSTDSLIKTIFNTKTSPFWYRQYYQDKEVKIYSNGQKVYKSSMDLIDKTLQKFGVNKIVTGHTIVSDTISLHYMSKVINVDTQHAASKSEALLVEKDKLYRIDAQRGKFFLAQRKNSVDVYEAD